MMIEFNFTLVSVEGSVAAGLLRSRLIAVFTDNQIHLQHFGFTLAIIVIVEQR